MNHLFFSSLNPFRLEESHICVVDASHHGLGDSLMKAPFVKALLEKGAESVDVLTRFGFAYSSIKDVREIKWNNISPLLQDKKIVKRLCSNELTKQEEEILFSDFMKYFASRPSHKFYFTLPASNFMTKVTLALAKRSRSKAIIMLKDNLKNNSKFVQVDFRKPNIKN